MSATTPFKLTDPNIALKSLQSSGNKIGTATVTNPATGITYYLVPSGNTAQWFGVEKGSTVAAPVNNPTTTPNLLKSGATTMSVINSAQTKYNTTAPVAAAPVAAVAPKTTVPTSTFRLPDPTTTLSAIMTKTTGAPADQVTDSATGVHYYLVPGSNGTAQWYGQARGAVDAVPVTNPTTAPVLNSNAAPIAVNNITRQQSTYYAQNPTAAAQATQAAAQATAQAAAQKAAADKAAADKAAADARAAAAAKAQAVADINKTYGITATTPAALAAAWQAQLNQAQTQDQLNKVIADANTTGVTINQGAIDRANTVIQQKQTTAAAKQQQVLNDTWTQKLSSATTVDQLNKIISDAQTAGATINPGTINQATTVVQQKQTAADKAAADAQAQTAAAALTAKQNDYINQLSTAKNAGQLTTDKLNTIVNEAQKAGVTFDANTLSTWGKYATTTDQTLAQQVAAAKTAADKAAVIAASQADFATKLGTPTGFTQTTGPGGQAFVSMITDPATGAGSWYQQVGNDFQRVGADGRPTGPVIPGSDFNQQLQAQRANYQTYTTQQADAAKQAKLATDVKTFESQLPQPGTAEYTNAVNNRFNTTGPNGQDYQPTPTGWVVSQLPPGQTAPTKSTQYVPVGATTGKAQSLADIQQTFDAQAAAQNAAAQAQRQQLIADQAKSREGMSMGDFGKLVLIMAGASMLMGSGILGSAVAGDVSTAAAGMAESGMSASEIAAELQSTMGINAAAANTAANTALGLQSGVIDAASLLPTGVTTDTIAAAAGTADPIAALNASAGWGASDIGYLQSIGASPDIIAAAGANNVALGLDPYGLNLLNAAETADLMSGINPNFVNFLTEEASGSAASEALGHGLTMGSSGLGMTAGTVPGLATMGGAGGLTIPAAGGGILSELGVFFPAAVALAALGGGLGAGAAAAGLAPGTVVEPPLQPLTPGTTPTVQPVTSVEAVPPAPPVEVAPTAPTVPVETVSAPVAPPAAPPAAELGGFRPGTVPGSSGLGLTAGTGVPAVAEMGGASGLTIPAAGGGILSQAGVTAAGAGGAALLGNLGSGVAAAGLPPGTIVEPVAPTPQPNLTDMGGGRGLNPAAPAEPGLTAGTGAPNIAEMGGAQGLTIPAAGGGTLTQAGVAAGAGSALTGGLGTASNAVATGLPSNTSVPSVADTGLGTPVVDRVPDWTNPNPTPDKTTWEAAKDLGSAVSEATGIGAGTAGLVAGAVLPGLITPPAKPKWAGWGPIDPLTLKHLTALEAPGVNPGYFTRATPFYNTQSPVQSEYYWGQHPYQSGAQFSQTQYNAVPAPVQPWGLQQMYTPTDINQYLAQLKADAAGTLAAPAAPARRV